jgi:hypothetical protein
LEWCNSNCVQECSDRCFPPKRCIEPCDPCAKPCDPCRQCDPCKPCDPCARPCDPCKPCDPCARPCDPCKPCDPCARPCDPCKPCDPCARPCDPCIKPCDPCRPCDPCKPCDPCVKPCEKQWVLYPRCQTECFPRPLPCYSPNRNWKYPCVPNLQYNTRVGNSFEGTPVYTGYGTYIRPSQYNNYSYTQEISLDEYNNRVFANTGEIL